MRLLTSAEVGALAKELSRLKGYIIRDAKEIGREIILVLKGNDETYLLIMPPFTINETKYMKLNITANRKKLRIVKGAKIEDIRQRGNDRVIEIFLERGKDKGKIVIELFGKGSVEIELNGEKYAIGESSSIQKDLSSISGPYKREIEYLKETLGIGEEEAMEKIRKGFEAPNPVCYTENGKVKEFSFFPLAHLNGETTEFKSISELLDEVYKEIRFEEKEKRSKEEEIKKSIEKLEKGIEERTKEEKELRSAAEEIMKNMNKINIAIEMIKKGAKKEDIERETGIKIIDINKKEKTAEIEVQ
ncbi:MAG: hypothetical protein QXL16_01345 [Candidatus Micrarchaeaceae archaeon]